jgi:hypothetical protein
MDNAFPTDLNEEPIEKTQLQMDEELAILLQNEYINELCAIDEEQQRQNEFARLRKQQNEENARIRIEQDMAYLESLRVIPKNTNTEPQAESNDKNIPPPPPPAEPEIIKPPEHYICPITNKLITIPICDTEDGICYDKPALLQYLKEHDNKNPNGKPMNMRNLVVKNNLKMEITYWKNQHPEYIE